MCAHAVDITGTVFKNGSVTLLARVVGPDAVALTQADVTSIALSVYLLDDTDPDSGTVVTGHSATVLVVAATIFDTLQVDELWKDPRTGRYVDQVGFNFKHVLAIGAAQAFATAGRNYRIVATITPVAGEVILVRFRVHCI